MENVKDLVKMGENFKKLSTLNINVFFVYFLYLDIPFLNPQ